MTPIRDKVRALVSHPVLSAVEPIPVIAHFPFAMGASEPLAYYRNAYARHMRVFVIYWLGELADEHTIPEAKALALCTYIAKGQLERALHVNEVALISECVRDVIGARESYQTVLSGMRGGQPS